eukprot:CAMPEP_0198148386 /NCGR_PEP_ID=MMETSP1443-20131203/41142_1 /TAXON_ID=186043 /ORGANISM="Entomoneis sp., Strain CCMP2396" /LENGTH=36 /DNA_ID= /DNA_START= /DNA_END= /DNA_ORIENTATION=
MAWLPLCSSLQKILQEGLIAGSKAPMGAAKAPSGST